jgi:hypothetical protein
MKPVHPFVSRSARFNRRIAEVENDRDTIYGPLKGRRRQEIDHPGNKDTGSRNGCP